MNVSDKNNSYQLVEIRGNEQRWPSVLPSYGDAPRGGAPPIEFVTVYASMFRRRIKLLLGLTLLGMITALAIALTQPAYYRAHTSLELDGVNDMYLGIRDVSSGSTDSLTDSYMQTQAKVLGSETVIRRTLEKTAQRKALKDSSVGFVTAMLRKTGFKYFTPLASEDSGVGNIISHLTVRPVPLTRVIEVVYDDTDPFYAAAFANALTKEYTDVTVERRLEDTENTARWLTAYVSHLKQDLESSGRTLETYAHDSGLLGTRDSDTPAEAKLRDLQAELSKAHGDRVNKQALYDTVSNSPREGLSPSINPTPLREYQTKLSDLRSELAQASATLTPAHYRVQQLQAQINEIETLIDKEWQKTLTLIQSEYRASLLRERLLQESVQAQMIMVADQAGKRVHYDVLRRELETNQQVYNIMLQKAKESGVLSATKPTNVHVLDQAHPEALPFTPNLPIYSSVGSLSGLFVGFIMAAYLQRRENNLFAPGVLSGVPRLRELGIIPSAKIDRDAIVSGPRTRLTRYSLSASTSSKSRQHNQLSLREPASLFTEAFHATIASILRPDYNGVAPRIITITSAVAGDGKTTVVRNLGLALAGINRRVVLIEGDLRHPKLSKGFEIANSWGLSDILQSTNSFENMPFEALTRPTGKPGLFVVPSGPSVVNVSSLLHSTRMGAFLEALKQHVDLILIDSPPLLAVPDARILGSCSDTVILVIRAHKTDRQTFSAAAQQLINDRTPILGSILNDWHPRKGPTDPFQYQYSYRD